VDHGADPEQGYFGDDMTEEIFSELARYGALKVISRTSVVAWRSRDGITMPLDSDHAHGEAPDPHLAEHHAAPALGERQYEWKVPFRDQERRELNSLVPGAAVIVGQVPLATSRTGEALRLILVLTRWGWRGTTSMLATNVAVEADGGRLRRAGRPLGHSGPKHDAVAALSEGPAGEHGPTTGSPRRTPAGAG
jgi:hypothetical protein